LEPTLEKEDFQKGGSNNWKMAPEADPLPETWPIGSSKPGWRGQSENLIFKN